MPTESHTSDHPPAQDDSTDAVRAEPPPEQSESESVSVRVDELIAGRTVNHPIVSEDGVLLVRAGLTLTPRIRDLLREHRVHTVRLHPDDVTRMTITRSFDATALEVDSSVTGPLDELIDSGALFVANTGPEVRDSLVLHGRRAYDPELRESLTEQHRESGEALDGMLQDVIRGRSSRATDISSLTGTYLTQMTGDCDLVLSAAGDVAGDEELSNHCLQMSLYGMAIGIEMGLDAENVRIIGLCGLVHDWGMARVPRHIRQAEHKLSSMEFLEIQKHPIHTLSLLEHVVGIPSVVPLVSYQVHESPNGSGYPRRRRATSIHLFARILKVADAYVGLTSERSFRPPLMPYAAMESLLRFAAERHLDAEAARALLKVVSLFPVGSYVALSDGSVARVIRRNKDLYATPIVQRLQGSDGTPSDRDSDLIDLAESELSVVQAIPAPGSRQTSIQPEFLLPQAAPQNGS